MNYDKGEDFIKKLIEENKLTANHKPLNSEDDIKKRIKSIDKNEAIKKLNELGLGNIAEKIKNISDDELVKMISKNPALLKKINSFLK